MDFNSDDSRADPASFRKGVTCRRKLFEPSRLMNRIMRNDGPVMKPRSRISVDHRRWRAAARRSLSWTTARSCVSRFCRTAADPIAREELIRLLATFPELEAGDVGMSPERLRAALGL